LTDAPKPDRSLDGALSRALRDSRDSQSAGCPEAGILAAFMDRALPAAEYSHWELHFSSCARCQQHLAFIARAEAEPSPGAAQLPIAFRPRPWLRYWLAPALTAAAAVAFYITSQTLRPRGGPSSAAELASRTDAPAPPAVTALGKSDAPARGQMPSPAVPAGRLSDKVAALEQRAKDRTVGAERLAAQHPVEGMNQARALASHSRDSAPPLAAPPAPGLAAVAEQKQVAADEMAEAAPKRETGRVAAETPAGAKSVLVTEVQKQPAAREKELAARQESQENRLAQTRDHVSVPQQAPSAPAGEPSPEKGKKAQAAAGTAPDRALFFAGRRVPILIVPGSGTGTSWRIQDGRTIERSADHGRTWNRQPSPAKHLLNAGHAPSESVCWIVGEAGTILISVDGANWKELPSPTGESLIHVVAKDASAATITALSGKRFSTMDSGRTWQPL